MFQKVRSVIYAAPDLDAAKAWYSSVLGFAPYFDSPFYVGFDVSGFELGLDPNAAPATGESGGGVAYWSVPDAAAAHSRLLELGAKPRTDLQDVGGGTRLATVFDPFGNAVGIIDEDKAVSPGEAKPGA